MKKVVRKGFLLGLGLGVLGKEKIEKIIASIAKKNRINQKEGREVAKKVLKTCMDEHRKISKKLEPDIKRLMNDIVSISKEEIKCLSDKAKKSRKKPKKTKKKKR